MLEVLSPQDLKCCHFKRRHSVALKTDVSPGANPRPKPKSVPYDRPKTAPREPSAGEVKPLPVNSQICRCYVRRGDMFFHHRPTRLRLHSSAGYHPAVHSVFQAATIALRAVCLGAARAGRLTANPSRFCRLAKANSGQTWDDWPNSNAGGLWRWADTLHRPERSPPGDGSSQAQPYRLTRLFSAGCDATASGSRLTGFGSVGGSTVLTVACRKAC